MGTFILLCNLHWSMYVYNLFSGLYVYKVYNISSERHVARHISYIASERRYVTSYEVTLRPTSVTWLSSSHVTVVVARDRRRCTWRSSLHVTVVVARARRRCTWPSSLHLTVVVSVSACCSSSSWTTSSARRCRTWRRWRRTTSTTSLPLWTTPPA